jgi:hypothetical protein|mmetsp:Transcript_5766/g.19058  ORF Transcript_5766/g.19058 Transcript_5766/m.19058 type:complete len:160 (-) Transcript_5766:287-766(-)
MPLLLDHLQGHAHNAAVVGLHRTLLLASGFGRLVLCGEGEEGRVSVLKSNGGFLRMTERLHLGSPKAKSRRDVVVDATTGSHVPRTSCFRSAFSFRAHRLHHRRVGRVKSVSRARRLARYRNVSLPKNPKTKSRAMFSFHPTPVVSVEREHPASALSKK